MESGALKLMRILLVVLYLGLALPAHGADPSESAPPPSPSETPPGEPVLQIELRNGAVYHVPEAVPEAAEAVFSQLSEEEQRIFQRRRIAFLGFMASLVHPARGVLGAGEAAKDRVAESLPWKTAEPPPALSAPAGDDPPAAPRRSFGQRGRDLIQKLLVGLDRELWARAPLIASSNEFGMYLGTTGTAGAATTRWPQPYLNQALGIQIGLNRGDQVLKIDLVHDREWLERVLPVFVQANAAVRAFFYVAKRTPKEPAAKETGTILYPPGPGGLVDLPNYFAVTLGLGLSLPPINTWVFLKTGLNRLPLLRIELSPRYPWFVRLDGAMVRYPQRGLETGARWVGQMTRSAAQGVRATWKACGASLARLGRRRPPPPPP